MIMYNLYYNNSKLNKYPLSKLELDKITQMGKVNKYNENGSKYETISTSNIQIVKCHVLQ